MDDQQTTPAPGESEARELMLDQCAKLLARRATPAEVGRALGKEFGVPASDRPAALAAGLERLEGWLGVRRSDPRFDALALCESVVRSNASVVERLKAQARIDELRGEGAPAGDEAGMTDEQIDEQILRLSGQTG